jgi:serine protease Do
MIGRLEEAVVIVSNPRGLGAGFLIDSGGRLITNFHVVRGERYNDVTIFLKKDKGKIEKKVFRRAEVRAYSALLDCALLEIPSKELEGLNLPALDLADPQSIKTGMRVYAVGNPGVGTKILDHTVSQGILSSTNRNFNDVLYLQTTAAANPGNSGGPLLNGRGEVVGLVTFGAIFQEGLAFALPAWHLRHFLDNLPAYTPVGDNKNTGFRYHDPVDEKMDGAGGRD